jgi:hypothetical protein
MKMTIAQIQDIARVNEIPEVYLTHYKNKAELLERILSWWKKQRDFCVISGNKKGQVECEILQVKLEKELEV